MDFCGSDDCHGGLRSTGSHQLHIVVQAFCQCGRTGMTGDEWPDTKSVVEAHALPRLAAVGVRFVQVARAGPAQAALVPDTAGPAGGDTLVLGRRLFAEERERVVDADVECFVGELSIGERARDLQGADQQREETQRLAAN